MLPMLLNYDEYRFVKGLDNEGAWPGIYACKIQENIQGVQGQGI